MEVVETSIMCIFMVDRNLKNVYTTRC